MLPINYEKRGFKNECKIIVTILINIKNLLMLNLH
jgi:hypothetical protein